MPLMTMLAIVIVALFDNTAPAGKPSASVSDFYVCGDDTVIVAQSADPTLAQQKAGCSAHEGLLAPTENKMYSWLARLHAAPDEFDAWCDRLARYSARHGFPDPSCRKTLHRTKGRPCPQQAACS